MDINIYIKDLLFTHNCVIIPEFGGFIATYQSSEIQQYKNLIYPPSKSLSFNKQLQSNDGLLIHYISKKEDCDYATAKLFVENTIKGWQQKLNHHEIIVIPDVGKLYTNHDQKLIFLPELRKNFLLNTFGLKPISFAPQHILETTDSLEKEFVKTTIPLVEPQSISNEKVLLHRIYNRRDWVGLAASLLLIIFFSQLIIWQATPEMQQLNNLNLFNIPISDISSPIKATIIDFSSASTKETELNGSDKRLRPEPDEQQVEKVKQTENIIPDTGYYINFSSFKDENNAKALQAKLMAQHKKSFKIFTAKNGYFRVAMFAAVDKQTANGELDTYRSNVNPSLWMFHSAD